jgi:S-adenosylmethionine decarboxylase
LNTQAGLLVEAHQAKELVKHQLKSYNPNLEAPYIEHWVLQLHGVPPEHINDPERLTRLLRSSAEELELTVVSDHSHYFGPGVSTVLVLAESHMAAHTWPELGYIHLDVVTCVEKLKADTLEASMRRVFEPETVRLAQLEY